MFDFAVSPLYRLNLHPRVFIPLICVWDMGVGVGVVLFRLLFKRSKYPILTNDSKCVERVGTFSLSGSLDWRVWALTSTSVHLLILLLCSALVYSDCWPLFHHRRIKSLGLGARIRVKQVVDEHVICISQQKLWHYQAGGG